VGLVEAALEHMREHHPAAPVEEESVREIVSTRSYAIEYVAVYTGGYRPEAHFGLKAY
jgi:hypothetical protein